MRNTYLRLLRTTLESSFSWPINHSEKSFIFFTAQGHGLYYHPAPSGSHHSQFHFFQFLYLLMDTPPAILSHPHAMPPCPTTLVCRPPGHASCHTPTPCHTCLHLTSKCVWVQLQVPMQIHHHVFQTDLEILSFRIIDVWDKGVCKVVKLSR